jgi:putative ABC transport system permease protein
MTHLFGSDKLPPGVRRVFRLPWSRPEMRRDLDDELRFHLQMRVDDLRARGLGEPEAIAEATRRLGDDAEFRAYCGRVDERRALFDRAAGWFRDWAQDLGIAGRQARRSPAFTALAILTIALGIGANTAIFTVVHRLLIAPLPYPDGSQIVVLSISPPPRAQPPAMGPVLDAWQRHARTIGPIAAMAVDAIAVQDSAEEDTVVAHITPNYLSVLGLQPLVGRGFAPEDARPNAPAVAMITDGLWRRLYGGRDDVIGKTVRAGSTAYTIVGVTPPTMGDPTAISWSRSGLHEAIPSIYIPAPLDSIGFGTVIARLHRGVAPRQAAAELQDILAAVPPTPTRSLFTGPIAHCCARAIRAQDMIDQGEVQAVKVLFVAVGVLLLIACANVASLLMSRAWTRRREFAVRAALGAGRGRLARLVLTESVSTALVGGALGVALAWQGLRLIIALRPPDLAGLAGAHLDAPVLLWSVGISIATGILFGSLPALFAGGRSVGDVLRGGTRAASADSTLRRLRSGLIVAEIAMALVLLVGAGLLVRSFVALEAIPPGFDPHDLVAVEVMMGPGVPRDAKVAIQQSILDRFRATPGVLSAAVGTMPGSPWHMIGTSFETDPDASGRTRHLSFLGVVPMGSDYFQVARMPIIQGRAPAPPTGAQASDEIVVNRVMARRLWPDGHAMGAHLHAVNPRMPTATSYTVVGVVDGAHLPSITATQEPVMYQDLHLPGDVSYILRVSGDPGAVISALRRVVADASASAIAHRVTIGDDYIRDALAPTQFAMVLLGTFAIIALLLSAVGLYGMIAYSVSQRTREIGVRFALGAAPATIARLVVGHGLLLAVAGVAIGAGVSIAATRALRGMLYAVTPSDPATFALIALLVVAIALLASYMPARRALRVDPTEALRAN